MLLQKSLFYKFIETEQTFNKIVQIELGKSFVRNSKNTFNSSILLFTEDDQNEREVFSFDGVQLTKISLPHKHYLKDYVFDNYFVLEEESNDSESKLSIFKKDLKIVDQFQLGEGFVLRDVLKQGGNLYFIYDRYFFDNNWMYYEQWEILQYDILSRELTTVF